MNRAIVFVTIGALLSGLSSHVDTFALALLISLAGMIFLVLAGIATWNCGKKTGYDEGKAQGLDHGILEGITTGRRLGEADGRASAIGRPMSQDQLPANKHWLVLAHLVDPVNPLVVLRDYHDQVAVPLMVVVLGHDMMKLVVGQTIRTVYDGKEIRFAHPDGIR